MGQENGKKEDEKKEDEKSIRKTTVNDGPAEHLLPSEKIIEIKRTKEKC